MKTVLLTLVTLLSVSSFAKPITCIYETSAPGYKNKKTLKSLSEKYQEVEATDNDFEISLVAQKEGFIGINLADKKTDTLSTSFMTQIEYKDYVVTYTSFVGERKFALFCKIKDGLPLE